MNNNQKEISYSFILKRMVALSIPTIIEQVLQTVVQYVDTAMVGRLGQQATAAVSVTTTITWLVNSLMSAFGIGILAMISKASGEKNQEKIRDFSVLAGWFVAVIGMTEGIAVCFLSSYIPDWMGAAPEIRQDASLYFFIVSAPMLFRASSTIFGAAIRASGDMRTPMMINVGVNGINIVLNYILIYQAGLGVKGAALSSAISYVFGGSCMFLAFMKKFGLSKIGKSRIRKIVPQRETVKQALGISIPVVFTNTASCMGYVVFASLVSGMGTTIFAAHSIAVTAETLFYIPGYGMNTAVSAMIGYSLGEDNWQKFDRIWKLAVLLAVGLMCINGAILYFASNGLMSLFTPEKKVIALGAKMLRIVALSEPFFGLMVIMQGIYHGLGRTGYAFVSETASMWGIRIFFSMLCVKVWGLGLSAVWYCMVADNVVKSMLYTIRFLIPSQRRKLWGKIL
ncbi:MAG: MATE family efflux transporter [Lachnospiraceae bacterium]|nr:MATE family efflux transporter [Lachnospiraceae bacterium]